MKYVPLISQYTAGSPNHKRHNSDNSCCPEHSTNLVLESMHLEANALKSLTHKNLCQLHDSNLEGVLHYRNGKSKLVAYIVMDLACQGDLFDLLAPSVKGHFSEGVALQLFAQLINALQQLHE